MEYFWYGLVCAKVAAKQEIWGQKSKDIVVILNADVLLQETLKNLAKHYNAGYDSVTVLCEVKNMSNLYARYVGLHYFRKLSDGIFEKRKPLNGIFWSETFQLEGQY